jgi:hypothetical protein
MMSPAAIAILGVLAAADLAVMGAMLVAFLAVHLI